MTVLEVTHRKHLKILFVSLKLVHSYEEVHSGIY